jgi:hypothetical protein
LWLWLTLGDLVELLWPLRLKASVAAWLRAVGGRACAPGDDLVVGVAVAPLAASFGF